jgi:hypothetical protein
MVVGEEEVRVLMRVRWQEELLWKLWKQYAKLDTWRSEKAERIETEIYAKLIAVLIEHWLTIVGCWHNPKRSLRKAQQVCQWMSNGLSQALQGKMDLEELIEDILKPMQNGCRVDARSKNPSTYQYIARRSSCSRKIASRCARGSHASASTGRLVVACVRCTCVGSHGSNCHCGDPCSDQQTP